MPRIQLKPNSPEFADPKDKPKGARPCDMPGCREHGEFRAPKARETDSYYWFCLPHVQEYNKAWDFFSGMSNAEVEDHILRSALWDRPTRKFHSDASLKEKLHTRAWQAYNYTEQEPKPDQSRNYRKSQISRHSPEYEAMAIMGLEPPLDLSTLRARYKELVKKYHPDVNRDDPKAEDILKRVNMAYTILKLAHEKFEKFAGDEAR